MLERKIASFTETQRKLLWIAPLFTALPISIQRFDEPLFPYAKVLVNATQELVCGYVFDFAHFLTFGAAGAVALERSLRYVPQSHVTLLHGAFADAAYARLADTLSFGGDALTVLNVALARTCQALMPQATFVTLDDQAYDLPSWQRELGILQAGQMQARVTQATFLQRISTEDFIERIREGLATL